MPATSATMAAPLCAFFIKSPIEQRPPFGSFALKSVFIDVMPVNACFKIVCAVHANEYTKNKVSSKLLMFLLLCSFTSDFHVDLRSLICYCAILSSPITFDRLPRPSTSTLAKFH
jgi:hypothetical protein